MVIGNLVLRLATVSLPPVAQDYYAECIVIFGRGLSRSSREKGVRIINLLFRPSIAARVAVRVNFGLNLTIYSS